MGSDRTLIPPPSSSSGHGRPAPLFNSAAIKNENRGRRLNREEKNEGERTTIAKETKIETNWFRKNRKNGE